MPHRPLTIKEPRWPDRPEIRTATPSCRLATLAAAAAWVNDRWQFRPSTSGPSDCDAAQAQKAREILGQSHHQSQATAGLFLGRRASSAAFTAAMAWLMPRTGSRFGVPAHRAAPAKTLQGLWTLRAEDLQVIPADVGVVGLVRSSTSPTEPLHTPKCGNRQLRLRLL